MSLACLATFTAAPASAAAEDEWSVTRVAGGYKVTLNLDEKVPMDSSAPSLLADGKVLGPATESADGKSLFLVTADPTVVAADEITTDVQAETAPARVTAAAEVPALVKAALQDDPSTAGTFQVKEGVYDFGDQAIPLLNIGGIRGELTGKIYLPVSRDRKPLVVFLHGRHGSCYGTGATNPNRWPCKPSPDSTSQRATIPSYIGYDLPARALASNGYAVVSISANAINSNDNQLAADYGAQARGQLILDTLTMLENADDGDPVEYHDAFTNRDVTLAQALTGAVTPADLKRAFDFQNVGIMGHSRGGEGVTAAATLNDALPLYKQFGIKAVLPLAPVDYDRISVPNTVMATILPYCDGDVENLMGQHIVDDSRHSFDDDVLRSAVLVQGANHNFFNTIWTPGLFPASTGDDWSVGGNGANDPVCNPAAPDTLRLTAPEQEKVGAVYMPGFFRLVLGGEKQFLPLFDGSPVSVPSIDFSDVTSAATQPAGSRQDLATFETADPNVTIAGDAGICASMGGTGGLQIPQDTPFCATATNQAALPHWSPATWAFNIPSSPMLRLKSGTVTVNVPQGDLSAYEQLSVKIAADETVATSTDVTVTVTDGAGKTATSKVSDLNARAVTRLPGVTSAWLKKIILQQVNIPLTGLNTADIRTVSFTGTGVYLSDLSAENRAVGARVSRQEIAVDVAPARVDEGSGPGTASIAVALSAPAAHEVTGYVSVFGSATGRAGISMKKVTFAPGQTCVTVPAGLLGDTVATSSVSTSFKVSVTNTAGAVMGDGGFGTLTVREDDGNVTSPAFGKPGDACAEYAASLKPGNLIVTNSVVAGGSNPVKASGYRAGESVEFKLDATVLGRAVADATGTVTFTAAVPAGTPVGKVTISGVGAGSGYTTSAVSRVRAS
ncbi:hypothetical protein [Herbidospora mongoliensis]|uniref:hypothetical protein n=1 Tax=Herbidospora mongoliensis TaxID=688067 RepID=UPI00083432F2|nr:hypothetical protein [Herbidospora mongoliensis]